MPINLAPQTRRQFLARIAATAGYCAGVRSSSAAKPAGELVALIADTHLSGEPKKERAGQKLLPNFRRVREEILAFPVPPSRVLLNGDCAFLFGEEADYQLFLDNARPILDAGLPIHISMGNHDDRDQFWKLVAPEGRKASGVADKYAVVVESPQVNWFLIDSLERIMATPGSLGEIQLDWLDHELGSRSDKPAFILCHHNFNFYHVKPHAKIIVDCADHRLPAPGLTDGKRLLDVLAAHSHVSAFFCGHTHQWNVVDWNGIRLVNLPSAAYPFRIADAIGWVACRTYADRAELELRSLDPAHKHHGQKVELPYRPS